MVNVLAYYSDDPSSHLADIYSFYSVKLFGKNENKNKKEAWNGPFLTIHGNNTNLLIVCSFPISY